MDHAPPADAVGSVLAAAGVLPASVAMHPVTVMPDVAAGGVQQPWSELADSSLWLPTPTAFDISLQRIVSVELLLDPNALPVPAVGDTLHRAAEAVLGRCDPETVLRVAMHWAFACEVYHGPWPSPRETLAKHSLSVPGPNRQHISDAVDRLIVPQTVRLIGAEAVCSSRYANAAEIHDPAHMGVLARSQIEAFLPSAVTGRPPRHCEIRTALWILSHDSRFEMPNASGPSALMAHTFGGRSIGEPHQSLQHWLELINLPDDHPHRSWLPGRAPSDLRADLRTSDGLELSEVADAVYWMLTMMIAVQGQGNQLFTLATLMATTESPRLQMANDGRHNEQEGARESALAFVFDHLVTSVDQMRDSLRLDDIVDTGDAGSDETQRRRCIETRFVDRPLAQFDDGTLVPVGLPDAAHGTIECCQTAHNGQQETPGQRRQRIGETLGQFFEARVRQLCHAMGDSYLVIGSDVIDKVIDRVAGKGSKRADVIIGDSYGCYVVLEATKRNLQLGIRYGDQQVLDAWADAHLRKYEQAEATAEHLHAITAARDAPTPRNVACVVVGDLPLRQNIGLSAIFDARAGRQLPPFMCGITEFEMLTELGPTPLSVPSLICAWQASRTDVSLGKYLATHPAT